MHRLRRYLARAGALALPVLIFSAISLVHPAGPQRRVVVSSATVTSPRKPLAAKSHPIAWGKIADARNRKVWVDTIRWNSAVAAYNASTTTTTVEPAPTVRIGTAASVSTATISSGSAACGGDLPPCYVCQRESHCTYGIVSVHSGCSGWHCYGKWQFDPTTWRSVVDSHGLNVCTKEEGKSCVPIPDWPLTSWSDVRPWMEDAVARAAWANGAGCGAWVAC